jgi:hypothetical protein
MPTDMIITFASETQIKAMNDFWELFKTIKMPQPQTEPSPQPDTPKGPTKALVIIADELATLAGLKDPGDFYKAYWNFFTTDYGQAVGCRDDPVHWEVRHNDRNTQGVRIYPGGEFSFVLFGEKCKYKNSGNTVGKLFCGENERPIDCFWDPPAKDPGNSGKIELNKYECKKNWVRQTVFTCPF